MISVYLCGKIRNISYDQGTDWRNVAAMYLEEESDGEVRVLDPMRNKENLAGAEHMPRNTEAMFCQTQNVWARDVWDVRHCDILLADLRWGNGRFTMFEMGMAYALGKPIILVTDDPARDDSICLQYAPAAIFDNLDDALTFILSMGNSL